ncbi:MAG: hypothetical protein GX595_20925 [Lentisphaerae bacterium]|nr:hypothetical protein [Lentisphaerota bacterium]
MRAQTSSLPWRLGLSLWAVLGGLVACLAAEPPGRRDARVSGVDALTVPPGCPVMAPPVERELRVPFEALPILLEGDTDHVLMPRQEFEALRDQAARQAAAASPRPALLIGAEVEIAAEAERAVIRARLHASVLADGLHLLPLSFSGVGLRRAEAVNGVVGAAPPALGRLPDGRLGLILSGQGDHTLAIEAVAPLQTTAAEQVLDIGLPTPPGTRVILTVPGDVEIRGGAAVIARRSADDGATTRFELTPGADRLTVVMSHNRRRQGAERAVVARTILIDEVTEAYERLHASVVFEVFHQAADVFRIALPAGFEVTAVTSPLLSRWAVQPESSGQLIEVFLRQAVTERVVLHLSALRLRPALDDWRLPRLEPRDVAGQVAVVGVMLEQRLRLRALGSSGVIPIDHAALVQALPPSLAGADPGRPAARTVFAAYAPAEAFAVHGQFERPPADRQVTDNLLLTLRERGLALRGGLTVLSAHEPLFDLELEVPAGWDVTGVRAEDGTPWRFEHDDGADSLPGRLLVHSPKAIEPGLPQTVVIDAVQVPPGWLEPWQEQRLALPALRLHGATSHSGAVAVQVADDLHVRPEALQGLTPLNENEKDTVGLGGVATALAFRHESEAYAATLAVTRVAPRLTAETCSFFRVEPDALMCEAEVTYAVTEARVEHVELSLPLSTPRALSIRGLGDTSIKEYVSQDDAAARRWRVDLAQPASGSVRLAVAFQVPFDTAAGAEVVLPLVRAEGVAYQSGFWAVEGHADMDVQAEHTCRRADIGELAGAEYQPGPRLLGAFRFVGDPPEARLRVRRPAGCPLPEAIVQQAGVLTVLSTAGRAQSRAAYRLRAKALYLEIELPEASELWSVTLDGTPVAPQQEGGRVLVDLSAAGPAERVLQVVYETPVATLCGLGRLALQAPRLLFRRRAEGPGEEVPRADMLWEVYLPQGYEVLRTAGTVAPTTRLGARPLAVSFWRQLWRLGGGADFRHGLLGGCMATLQSSHERARQISQDSIANEKMYGAPSVLASELDEVAATRAAGRADADADALVAAPAAAKARAKDKGQAGMGAGMPGAMRDGMAAESADSRPRRGLEGARSLAIDLGAEGSRLTYRSLGDRPALRLLLAERRRLTALSWCVGVGLLVLGFAWARREPRRLGLYQVALLGLGTLLPALPGGAAWTGLWNAVVVSGLLLLAGHGLSRLASRLSAGGRRRVPAVVLAVLAVGLGQWPLDGQGAEAPTAPVVVEGVPLHAPLRLPREALIAPFDPGQAAGEGRDLLVPRHTWEALWRAANPDPYRHPAPLSYALTELRLAGTLSSAEALTLTGTLLVDSFTDGPLEVPLALDGAVLTRAVLDGHPAPLRALPAARIEPLTPASALPPVPQGMGLVLPGRGRHALELTLQVRLSREGGWRVAAGRLPAAAITALDLRVPDAGSEVRLGGLPDRAVYDATTADQVIRTTLPADGRLNLRWRPRVAMGQADAALTASTQATVDVLEDRLQATWAIELAFRQGDSHAFSLDLPSGYRIESITGGNVRGWQATAGPGATRVEVSLQQAARGREEVLVQAWGPLPASSATADAPMDIPVLSVPAASRHVGRILIRHSPALALRVEALEGVRRIDTPAETAAPVRSSPLGARPFQAFEFLSRAWSLRLAVRLAQPEVDARVQSILRIAERERVLESRVILGVRGRPLHSLRLAVPADLEIQRVVAPGRFEWSILREADGQILTVHLEQGLTGEIPVVLSGRLGAVGRVERVRIPRLWVADALRQEGDLAIQADPLYEVVPRDLVGLEAVLLKRLNAWLSESQRPLTRLGFHYRVPEHGGEVVLESRQADVRCQTVTNVRVTERAIEETTLLAFTIHNAGVQELRFRLPEALAQARISVPHLRRKTTEPVPESGQVRVVVELQDQVMNEVRVLVEHDRLLDSAEQEVVLPVVETGRTDRQYLAVESAGRDEVVVDPGTAFRVLTPQQHEWSAVAALLQGGVSQAYLAVAGPAVPRLTFRTRTRQAVETVGARIGLAEALLILDDAGAYRASQSYHVDNRTEQFLDLELPDGSALWTVHVGGIPAKPIQADAATPRRVRVPLVKTAAGDLDYVVALTYAGSLPRPGPLRPLAMPLVRTLNVNVEQSQVELWLPRTRRWFGFDGSLRRVRQGGEFEAGYLAYQNQLAKRLMDTLQSGSAFEQARAVSNLKAINLRLAESQQAVVGDLASNAALVSQVTQAQMFVQDADAALRRAESAQVAPAAEDNRLRLNRAFAQQATGMVRNQVTQLGGNWFEAVPAKAAESGRMEQFDVSAFVPTEPRSTTAPATLAPQPAKPAPGRRQAWSMMGTDGTDAPRDAKEARPQAGAAPARGDLQQRLELYQRKLDSAPMAPGAPGVVGVDLAERKAGVAGAVVAGRPAATPMGGLASLSVGLPGFDGSRWVSERFTTPRGELVLRARALSAAALEALERLLAALLVVVLAVLVAGWCRRAVGTARTGRAAAGVLMLVGLVSLLAGVLPGWGLLALVAGGLWRVVLAVAGRLQRAQGAGR